MINEGFIICFFAVWTIDLSLIFTWEVFFCCVLVNLVRVLPTLAFKDQWENIFNLFSLLLWKVTINIILNISFILLLYLLIFVVVLKQMLYVILGKIITFVSFLVYFYSKIFLCLTILIFILGTFPIFILKIPAHQTVILLIFYPLRYHTVHNIIPYPINLSVDNLSLLEVIPLYYDMFMIMGFRQWDFTLELLFFTDWPQRLPSNTQKSHLNSVMFFLY